MKRPVSAPSSPRRGSIKPPSITTSAARTAFIAKSCERLSARSLNTNSHRRTQETKGLSREDALAEFIRHQLHPLTARDELSRHFRIFNWEAVRPTTVYRKLLSEEAAPFLGLAVDLVRRFMPDADWRTLNMAAVWLVGQCSIFIRNRDQLANPPVSLDLDERAVEQLTTLVSGWALSGLGRGSGAPSHSEP